VGTGIDACGEHRPDQRFYFRGPAKRGFEQAPPFGMKRAAAAVAQRVAIALGRARALPVAVVRPAIGNIIVRPNAGGDTPIGANLEQIQTGLTERSAMLRGPPSAGTSA